MEWQCPSSGIGFDLCIQYACSERTSGVHIEIAEQRRVFIERIRAEIVIRSTTTGIVRWSARCSDSR